MYNIDEIKNKIICGDCLEVMKLIPDNSVDSIVTDPPYELGFMGKSWDNTGIANNVEMWAECLRVLKPGGHLLAFSGTRTYHRMASAIEDAGFEVRDMIEWVYGSGFPKSLNIGKAVDKLQGNKREETDYIAPDGKKRWGGNSFSVGEEPDGRGINKSTKGTSKWEGWGTALKPAHEPICMARKPISEKTVAENCLKWGTGGINIDESRVETSDSLDGGGTIDKSNYSTVTLKSQPVRGRTGAETGGRFPANLIHDNSEEVRECFPDLGRSSKLGNNCKSTGGWSTGLKMSEKGKTNDYSDSGNASRFFKSISKEEQDEIQEECTSMEEKLEKLGLVNPKSIIYQAKASKSERNKGCDGLEEKESPLLNGQIRNDGTTQEFGGFSGQVNRNNHPTVKPIALMEYLIKMVTPKGGIVLDPFAGSGTTCMAAKKVGRDFIGIEKEPDYVAIAEARIKSIPERW